VIKACTYYNFITAKTRCYEIVLPLLFARVSVVRLTDRSGWIKKQDARPWRHRAKNRVTPLTVMSIHVSCLTHRPSSFLH